MPALKAQTCSGNAFSIASQTGVDNAINALNAPDALAAQLWDTGDMLVVNLNKRLISGSTIILTWRGNTVSSADPIVVVETSLDGTTFTAVTGSPFTVLRDAAYYTTNIITPNESRYVRFTTTNVYNLDLDALTFANQTCSPLCGTATAGTVWRDFNGNGTKEISEIDGVANVVVTAYDNSGSIAETTTTNSLGEFTLTTLTPSTTNKYRIEYSNIPALYKPTFNGSSGQTDIQFLTAATCDLNYGVNIPTQYCQANPALMINCYVSGAYSSSSGTGHTIVGLPYNDTQDPDGNVNGTTVTGNPMSGTFNPAIYTPARPIPTPIADHNQVGSTWGLAYSRTQKNLFVAAYIKAGMSLGPTNESTGKIYKIYDPLGVKTTSDFVDLNVVFGAGTAGTNSHPIATTNFAALGDAATNAVIGKVGLGDIAISHDEAFLYVVNLADRMLYKIPTSGTLNSTTITRFAIPTAGLPTVTDSIGTAGTCASADMRPFGLGIDPQGDIYIGGVCSCESISSGFNAEPNLASFQLTAYVWKFDGAAFSLVVDESLRFDRDNNGGYTTDDDFTGNSGMHQDWEPWHNLSNAAIYNTDAPAQNEPMLSDITFDENGDMFLGVRDRLGDCVTLNGGFLSSGDIYKVSKTGGSWTFENNGTAGGITTSGANNGQGPGGGEFIYTDIQGDGILNSGTGGVFNLIGRYQVLSTAVDAVYLNSSGQTFFNPAAGGVQVYDTQNGDFKGAFNLYESNDINTFAKAAGVGAIAALCEAAPLQIGNYVWFDLDKDGTQDPSETPLSGVKVALYKSIVGVLTLVANTETTTNGGYFFTGLGAANETWISTSGIDSLLPDMDYVVVFGTDGTTPQFVAGKLTLAGTEYTLTDVNSGEGTNPDLNDSDASLMTVAGGSFPSISLTTGAAGSTNHTFEAGFKIACTQPTAIDLIKTAPTCAAGIPQNDGIITLTAITDADKFGVSTGATYSGTPNYAAATTISAPDDLQINIPNAGATYTIRFFNGADNCFKDTTIVVEPVPMPDLAARDTTICAGNAVDLSTLFTMDSVAGTVEYFSNYAEALAGTPTTTAAQTPIITTEFFIKKTTSAGCSDIDSVDVTVSQPVSAGTATNPEVCMAASGLPFVNLFAQLAGETAGGIWTKISGPSTGINFDAAAGTLDPNGLPIGVFVFEYAVVGTTPCPNNSELVAVTIKNCTLPCPPKVCLPIEVVKVNDGN